MADNTQLGTNVGVGDLALTLQTTFSGDSCKAQGVVLLGAAGSNDSWTVNVLNGTTSFGLFTDVKQIAAGANLIGDVGLKGRASGGPTSFFDNDGDEDGVVVKAAAGQLFWLHVMNLHTAPLFLRLYNKSTTPTSSDTPVHCFPIPSQGTSDDGGGFSISLPLGIPFSAGISYRVTAGPTNGDTTAVPSANLCYINGGYS